MVLAVVKKKSRRPTIALLLSILISLRPATAKAHPEIAPTLVNRYLSVIAIGDRLEFFITLLFGPLPAAEERKKMDLDGNGTIAPGELEHATQGWRARASTLARIWLDEAALPLDEARASVQLGADQGVSAAPLVIEIYGARPLAAGTRRVLLEPGWEPARLGETEISVDLAPDWELVSSRQGSGAEGTERRFLFEGRRPSLSSERAVIFTIRSSQSQRPRATIYVVFAVAALASLALTFELRRRRQRRSV